MDKIADVITITSSPRSFDLPAVVSAAIFALRACGFLPKRRAVVLSVSCVSAIEMRRLNRKYRGKNSPTDVLSFEQTHSETPKLPLFLGDLVLCTDVVRRQAKEHRHVVRIEAGILTVHGLLHLLGYDHEKSTAAEAKMRKAELKVLKKIGIVTGTGLIARAAVKS